MCTGEFIVDVRESVCIKYSNNLALTQLHNVFKYEVNGSEEGINTTGG